MERGEVWWASLPDPMASEPGFRRPVLIIQSNSFNRSKIGTVIILVLTSNLRLSAAPGNVMLQRKETGLPKDSVANVSQIITVDRSFLIEKSREAIPRSPKENRNWSQVSPRTLSAQQSIQACIALAVDLANDEFIDFPQAAEI